MGAVLGLALARELTPVVTSIIVAGRVGSAFAAELGTMQVSEQTDSLRVLGSDPMDYLVTPRVLACMVAVPILNLLCFCMGLAASVLIAEAVYSVSANVILDSAMRAVAAWDIVTSMLKCLVFGAIIASVINGWCQQLGFVLDWEEEERDEFRWCGSRAAHQQRSYSTAKTQSPPPR